jgi:hypothetical protein
MYSNFVPQALAFFRGGSIEDIEAEANAIMAEAGELDNSGNDRMGINAFLKTTKLYLQLFVVVCMHLSQQVCFYLKGHLYDVIKATDYFSPDKVIAVKQHQLVVVSIDCKITMSSNDVLYN